MRLSVTRSRGHYRVRVSKFSLLYMLLRLLK